MKCFCMDLLHMLILAVLLASPTEANLFHFNVLGPDATTEAIQALDTDKSGRVERAEVEAFAHTQGLSVQEVQAEFGTLDTNHDGELDATEISRTLYDKDVSHGVVSASNAVVPPVSALNGVASLPPVSSLNAVASPLPDRTDKQAVEEVAKQRAGRTLAEVFSREAAKSLTKQDEDVQKAASLEEAARALRGQAAEIRRTAAMQTEKAAADAATDVFQKAEGQVRQLEKETAEAAAQASKQRTLAKQAMESAVAAQAAMAASVHQLQREETAH